MVDLHTHLLHDIDDGANQVEDAILFLEHQKKQGVSTVVLTPHFKSTQADLAHYCQLRAQRYQELLPHAERIGIELVLGCELMCLDKEILNLDLQQLTIANTSYLLMEFMPTVSKYTLFRLVESIERIGLQPILAHIERYDILYRKPDLLFELVNAGALLQINGRTILEDKGYYRKCLKKGLIQLVASDTHATDQRPPNLAAAYDHLVKKGINVAQLQENADAVVHRGFVDTSGCKPLVQVGGFYF